MRYLTAFAALTLVLIFSFGALALETRTDEELLQEMDKARFLSATTTTLIVEIVAETPDEVETALLTLYLLETDNETRIRIEFMEPEDVAGQVFLSLPEGTFLWQPELFEPIRTSATQAAFGDAAVAQISGVRFLDNYSITARTALDDGSLWELKLEALRADVAFQGVTVIVDANTFHPQKLELYAATGALLYNVLVESYADLNGDQYAEAQLVENVLLEGNRSRLTILEARVEELPAELFDPEALGEDIDG